MSSEAEGGVSAREPFLQGVKVIELTGALAGPYAATILADLGADVIKVERADGDPMRHRRTGGSGASLPFSMIHRNKSSLAVDLKSAEGREIVKKALQTADVVIENFRPGVVARMGLDYDSVKATNPAVVYCSVSGFGQTGVLSPLGGVDLIAQGYGGLMSVTGFSEDEPAKAGYPVSDFGTGMWAAIGIIAALLRRDRDGGSGAYIDVSLAECVAAWSLWEVSDYQVSGLAPGPLGTAHRLAAPYQAFRCKDGRFVNIGAVSRRWESFCDLLGADAAKADPRFSTEALRFENRPALAEILGEAFRSRDRDEWIAILRQEKIPCGPINTIPEMLQEEHLKSRGMFGEIDLEGQPVTLVRTPIVADGAPRTVTQPPLLGGATEAILVGLGYSGVEIDRFARDGIITRP
jgi:crotonobetainyl-CoA:carnitine CoA-transferase CaiB-like acyl-CoA transferase